MSMPWNTVEAEIYAWVSANAGGATVIWEDQEAPRPATPYITIRAEVAPVGQDAISVEDHPTPTPGAEIQYHQRGMRDLRVYLRCFGGSHRGASSSRAILEAIHSASFLPTQRAAFKAAGWAPARYSRIQDVSGVVGVTDWEPRAMLDVSGYTTSTSTEDGTYIQIVEGTNNIVSPPEAFSWDSGA